VSEAFGLWADALAAVEEAQLHNFSSSSAFGAAFAHLENANREEALLIASLLASWIAFDLNRSMHQMVSVTAADWVTHGAEILVRRAKP
jgi:hypothetical protein